MPYVPQMMNPAAARRPMRAASRTAVAQQPSVVQRTAPAATSPPVMNGGNAYSRLPAKDRMAMETPWNPSGMTSGVFDPTGQYQAKRDASMKAAWLAKNPGAVDQKGTATGGYTTASRWDVPQGQKSTEPAADVFKSEGWGSL